jgi:nucleoside-diphosphate-sugar epimerase
VRVAVTGGSGRIGCFVIKELLSRGHEVINLDRRQAAQPLARFVYAQLGQREQVQPALEGVDAVCHLGEIPSEHAAVSCDEVYAQNTRAGAVVLQTAADLRLKRIIYTSSCQVYGMFDHPLAIPRRLPFDETHPLAPHNAYALAKAANEGYAALIARRHGISVAAFRLPWVTGEEYAEETVTSLKKQSGKMDGLATYVHATDVARAYALALENPRPGFEAYHFTAAEVLSLQPLAKRLAEHHPDYPPLPNDWPAFKSPLLTAKAREHLGWEPRWNFLDFYREKHGEPGAA